MNALLDSTVSSEIIVRFDSVWECKNLSNYGPSKFMNNIIIRSLNFLNWRPIALVSYLFLSRSMVSSPSVLYIIFMFILSSQYHVTFNHMTVILVFIGKSIVELCDSTCVNFEIFFLEKLSMINDKVVCDKHYSLNIFCRMTNFLFIKRSTRCMYL